MIIAKWHLTEQQMENFSGNPIGNLESLVEPPASIVDFILKYQ